VPCHTWRTRAASASIVRGLARARYDQVHAFAEQAREHLPGATRWLERNRSRLDNKYHASKFYLLAVLLPWLIGRELQSPQVPFGPAGA
jgi:hypothetical protein